ncbi:MAG TPA: hypothetical protein VEI80_05710 [Candidatus Acidoferrales bacterium]|nr:hypothetical protein [Candidatus Acidoferrales bacterium]
MSRISAWLMFTSAVLILAIMMAPQYSQAQFNSTLQPSVSRAIAAVNNAEAAGATTKETAPLVAMLNEALALNSEASNLPPNQTTQRNALFSSVNQILTTVTNQANNLTTTSTQRTYTNKIITYVTGVVAAIVGTFVCVFGVEFYQRYRIKRTLQMRIKRK